MATKKKKAVVSDTVTFNKSELIEKLKNFLENESACDGDWVNKVRVEFLGEEMNTVSVSLQYETEIELEMASCGLPSAKEVIAKIQNELDEGNLDFDFDYSQFKVLSIKPA